MFKNFFKNFFNQPDEKVNTILDINPVSLKEKGIEKIIFDLDQTITIQNTNIIPEDILKRLKMFVEIFKSRNICFLSNNFSDERKEELEKKTGILLIKSEYRKPSVKSFEAVFEYFASGPSNKIAMIGDRTFTDMLGARKLGLYTIKVRPLSPEKDSIGAKIARKIEDITNKYDKISLIGLLLSFFSFMGIGIKQLFSLTNYFIANNFRLVVENNFYYFHIIFIVFSSIFYWIVTSKKSKIGNRGAWITGITFYFNTYPLFLRYVFSWLLVILSLIFHDSLPSYFLPLSIFYQFIIHIILLFSLSSYYHSNIGRIFRIIIDILIVLIIAQNLEPHYVKYALVFLFVPIGTAAKHFDWFGSFLINFIVIIISFLLLKNNYEHAIIFSILFLGVTFIIKLDTIELFYPFDRILTSFIKNRDNNLFSMLKIFSKTINCESVIYLKNKKEGYFYSQSENADSSGKLDNISTSSMYDYLIKHSEHVLNTLPSTSFKLYKIQKRLRNHLLIHSSFSIRPLPIEGIKSLMVTSLPDADSKQFLIFINSYTRNGVTKRVFSINHARFMLLCSIILVQSNFEIKYNKSLNTEFATQDMNSLGDKAGGE